MTSALACWTAAAGAAYANVLLLLSLLLPCCLHVLLLPQVLLGEPLHGVWAAATAALLRSRSVMGQVASGMASAAALHSTTKSSSNSSSRRQPPVPQLLALSGPGLSLQDAQQLMQQQAAQAAATPLTKPVARAVQLLGKQRRKGISIWAWLYNATAAAEQLSVQAEGSVSSEEEGSSTVEPAPVASRRRRRKTTRQTHDSNRSCTAALHQQGLAADALHAAPASSYRRAADAVLVLSCRELQLPQQHPQWGLLLQHQQLTMAGQGPPSSASDVQLLQGTGIAPGSAVAAVSVAVSSRQQSSVGAAVTPASQQSSPKAAGITPGAAAAAYTPAAAAAGHHLPSSVRLHHSSSSSQLDDVKQHSRRSPLFHAAQCR
jgi:hypothetical protein